MKKTHLNRQTMALTQNMLNENHPEMATEIAWFDTILQAIGNYQAVCPYIERSVDIDKKLGEENPDFASSLNSMAILKYYEAKYAEALELMEMAHTIWLKTLGPNHPHTKGCVQGLEVIQEAFKNQEAGALHNQFDLTCEFTQAEVNFV